MADFPTLVYAKTTYMTIHIMQKNHISEREARKYIEDTGILERLSDENSGFINLDNEELLEAVSIYYDKGKLEMESFLSELLD